MSRERFDPPRKVTKDPPPRVEFTEKVLLALDRQRGSTAPESAAVTFDLLITFVLDKTDPDVNRIIEECILARALGIDEEFLNPILVDTRDAAGPPEFDALRARIDTLMTAHLESVKPAKPGWRNPLGKGITIVVGVIIAGFAVATCVANVWSTGTSLWDLGAHIGPFISFCTRHLPFK